MATSGQVRTYEVDQGTYFYVNWQQASQNIPGNYTDINWQLCIYCRWNYRDNALRSNGVNINGSNVYGGATYSNINQGYHELTNGTTRIYHNTDGTKTFNINTSGWVIDGGNTSGSQDFTLNSIPRWATMNSASNFNDEQNPYFTYSNPANVALSCWIEPKPNGEHIAARNFSGTGGTYTWTLTEEERNQLRAKCTDGNSCKCRIGLYSTLGGQTVASFKDITMSIVNANPTFNDFTFQDINNTTTTLTGNNQKTIIGFSNMQISITSANKATANKQATMSKYRLVIGNQSIDIPYSSNATVSGNIANVSSGVFDLYAIDSRGNSTKVTKLANEVINYTPITLDRNNSYPYRSNDGHGSDGYLKYEGYMWVGNFGATTNAILSTSYRFKKTDSNTWITGATDITPTFDNNEFEFNNLVKSDNPDYTFDLDASYNFKVIIQDKLSSYEIELSPMASSIPHISLNKDGVGIMCDYNNNKSGALQVGGDTKIDGDLYLNDKEIGFLNDIKTYSNNSNGDITFTAPFNGIIDITAIWSGWGYDGGRVDLAISNTAGNAAQLQRIGSSTNGHNTEAVLIFSKAFYYVEKDKSYTFHFGASGNIGGALSSGMVAILRRGQSV